MPSGRTDGPQSSPPVRDTPKPQHEGGSRPRSTIVGGAAGAVKALDAARRRPVARRRPRVSRAPDTRRATAAGGAMWKHGISEKICAPAPCVGLRSRPQRNTATVRPPRRRRPCPNRLRPARYAHDRAAVPRAVHRLSTQPSFHNGCGGRCGGRTGVDAPSAGTYVLPRSDASSAFEDTAGRQDRLFEITDDDGRTGSRRGSPRRRPTCRTLFRERARAFLATRCAGIACALKSDGLTGPDDERNKPQGSGGSPREPLVAFSDRPRGADRTDTLGREPMSARRVQARGGDAGGRRSAGRDAMTGFEGEPRDSTAQPASGGTCLRSERGRPAPLHGRVDGRATDAR